jgi:hypothetical protein
MIGNVVYFQRPGVVELSGIEPLTSAVRLQRFNALIERKSQ